MAQTIDVALEVVELSLFVGCGLGSQLVRDAVFQFSDYLLAQLEQFNVQGQDSHVLQFVDGREVAVVREVGCG